ncbi:MAG TPA: type II toxin-antitoxin system YafQ family toxin [Flavobacteriaceae bacterium]|nr:type II toxin-antitoxin system YafQ family toxin [Flavobacteriaceae bacterium]
MYEISFTKSFERDVKTCKKRNYDLSLLIHAIDELGKWGKLPKEMNLHPLKDEFSDYLECHLDLDWLLIWKQDNKRRKISFHRTGTHADLFK